MICNKLQEITSHICARANAEEGAVKGGVGPAFATG